MSRSFACLLSLVMVSPAIARAAEPEVVYLWDGVAPGSEGLTGEEVVQLSDAGEHIVSNVHRPSLTVYPAEGVTAPALTVLVIPGGGRTSLFLQDADSQSQCMYSSVGSDLVSRLKPVSHAFASAIAAQGRFPLGQLHAKTSFDKP